MGQRKLFAKQDKCEEEEEEEFQPIFDHSRTWAAGRQPNDFEPGRGGSTRAMGHFPETHPKLIDFRRYLESVDGSQKSRKTALEISSDLSKYLFYVNPQSLKWSVLLDEKQLLSFFEELAARGIKSPGRLTKMERIGDALRYMRFSIRARAEKKSEGAEKIAEIDAIDEMLMGWKTTLRKQKKKTDWRLLAMSSLHSSRSIR